MRELKILISLAILCTFANSAKSAQIIYPKSNNVTINAESTFFVGNECPQKNLTINGEKVDIHTSGGFFHPVQLQPGENIFNITNGQENLIYKITRPKTTLAVQPVTMQYSTPMTFVTNQDNIPLRSTPVDAGLNRLQHLQERIPLTIVGEYGDFYKVRLARDDFAWVNKSHVKKSEHIDNSPAKIENYIYEEFPDKRIFTIKLNKKTPYILYENSGFDLTIYNVEGFFENKYELHINKTGRPFGYKSYYKNKSDLVIEIKNFPQPDKNYPLKGLNITIDPGHGGSEYGAVGCLGDKEKDINLAISLQLQKLLQQANANVTMTRNNDCEVCLSKRPEIANSNTSDIFISIHNNALPDAAAKSGRSGTSVYYFYPQSKELGKYVLDSMVKNLGLKNDGLRGESFAVIRNTQMPAILIEVGYLINPEDNAKLITAQFQQKAAQAIKQGLENYLNGIQQ